MILQIFLINGENVKKVPQTGFEPRILGAGGRRLIHEATKAHDTATENGFVVHIISNRYLSDLF